MQSLNSNEIFLVSGGSLSTFIMEMIHGPIPWGVDHALQYIDMKTFWLGASVGFLACASMCSFAFGAYQFVQHHHQKP